MNNILISDPFLYPPSGEDIFRGPLIPKNILQYSKSQFKQAWEVASSEFETTVKSFKLWPAVNSSSLAISDTSFEDLLFLSDQMDLQDNSWLQNDGDFNFPLNSDSYALETEGDSSVPGCGLGEDLFDFQEIDSDMIEDIFKAKEPITTTTTEETEQLTWSNEYLSNPQIVSGLMDLVNPSIISPETAEETANPDPPGQHRSRRKSHQVSRLVASDSPFPIHEDEETMADLNDIETKPNIAALSILNGSTSRGRKRVHATTSEQSTSSGQKRKRKYELEDSEDTSVKNAKAAKLNRDRKKREMQDLKEKVDIVVKENNELKEQVKNLIAAKTETEERYKQEKEKNLINNGLVGQLTNAKKILELIVPPLISNLGPMNVTVSDAFASIPVRTDEHNNILISDAQLTQDASFTGADAVSTYTTFHISPQERNIKVDYDPHYF